jgi:hypothetical protein
VASHCPYLQKRWDDGNFFFFLKLRPTKQTQRRGVAYPCPFWDRTFNSIIAFLSPPSIRTSAPCCTTTGVLHQLKTKTNQTKDKPTSQPMKLIIVAVFVLGLASIAMSQYVVSQPSSQFATTSANNNGASAGVNVGGVGAGASIGSASSLQLSALVMISFIAGHLLLRR